MASNVHKLKGSSAMEAINTKRFRKIANRIRYIIQQLRESGASIGKESSEVFDMIDDLAKEALITPPRNCDVGTAGEQYKRFQDFCLHNSFRGVCSERCPLYTQCTIGSYQKTGRAICFPAWTQLPYDTEKGQLK